LAQDFDWNFVPRPALGIWRQSRFVPKAANRKEVMASGMFNTPMSRVTSSRHRHHRRANLRSVAAGAALATAGVASIEAVSSCQQPARGSELVFVPTAEIPARGLQRSGMASRYDRHQVQTSGRPILEAVRSISLGGAILSVLMVRSSASSQSRPSVVRQAQADAKDDVKAEASTEAKAEEESSSEAEAEDGEEAPEEKSEEKAEKAEKWDCPACGTKNFPAATECHKCGATQPSEGEVALQEEKAKAATALASKMDEFLRLQADLQNYRRDHESQMARAKDLGKQDALRAMLPFTNVIDKAVEPPEDMSEKESKLFQSYSLLFGKVKETFGKFGAEPFEAEVGEEFDATRHKFQEFREPAEGEKSGVVVEVLRNGWKCDGKILIPSEVVVTKLADEDDAEAKEDQDVEDEETPEEEKVDETSKVN